MNTTENNIESNNSHSDTLFLTEAEAERWGAFKKEGCEADDCGEYRRGVIRELEAHVLTTGRVVEVYTPDYMLTIVGENLV